MALDKPNKRRALQPTKELVRKNAEVLTLRPDDMVIVSPRGPLYFKRLLYKNCPNVITISESSPSIPLVDMQRENFVRKMFGVFSAGVTATTESRFSVLIKFIQWVDSNNKSPVDSDWLHWNLIDGFMSWCGLQNSKGELSRQTWGRYRTNMAWILKRLNRAQEAKNLPAVKGVLKHTTHHSGLDVENELKPIVKRLFQAYRDLLVHYTASTLPKRHPLYDRDLLERIANEKGLKGLDRTHHFGAFSKSVSTAYGHPNNHISKIAITICFMFTGMNTTPLQAMKIADIRFREVQGGKYILDSVKGRAGFQEQDNALGFSKYAKEFIESWIVVSTNMAKGDTDAYLFPYYSKAGVAMSFNDCQQTALVGVSGLLERLGYPKITPSILRKTKMDTLFRVTESVYLVSVSANNSINVTRSTYSNGTVGEHENKLRAAMEAKFAHAKGDDISSAVKAAKFKYASVLDNYEYERLRSGQNRSYESRTPIGVRCNNNQMGTANSIHKMLGRLGIHANDNEKACTSFLNCFNCEQHALVADTTDIWLMLSFQETLQQLEQTPAINSLPPQEMKSILDTIENVLKGFGEKSPDKYMQATELQKKSSHPLYSSIHSLNDLLEVFV